MYLLLDLYCFTIHTAIYCSYKFKYKAALSFLGIIDITTGLLLKVTKGYPANVPDDSIHCSEQIDTLLLKHKKYMIADSGFHSSHCIQNQTIRWAVEAVFGRWKKHFV